MKKNAIRFEKKYLIGGRSIEVNIHIETNKIDKAYLPQIERLDNSTSCNTTL